MAARGLKRFEKMFGLYDDELKMTDFRIIVNLKIDYRELVFILQLWNSSVANLIQILNFRSIKKI